MSVLQQTTTETNNYALRVNESFDYPNTNPVIVLDACPGTAEIVTIKSNYTTGDSFTFETSFSDELYTSNALKFRFDIPIDITLENDASANLDESNFMKEALGNCADLCISQYGLIQALQNISVSLNGKVMNIPTNIAECINILSQYYNAEDIAEWFPASQPDMFQSFEQYGGSGSQALKFVNEDAKTAWTAISPEQDNNVFGAKYTRGYMSRTPVFTFVAAGTGADAKRKCKVRASFFTYLPLSFGSVPDKVTSLIGVNSLRVQMTMKPGMLGYLFNTRNKFFDLVQSMDLDRSTNGGIHAWMSFQQWGQPNGVVMPRNSVGLKMPYSIQLPDIQHHVGNVQTAVAAYSSRNFNHSDVQCNTVPKAVYVGLSRVKDGDFKKLTSTPINYGLITNLNISISGQKTVFPTLADLMYLADTNGYDAFTDTLGRLTKGFAVKLDLTKDLSVPGTTCVGASGSFRISVNGTFVNQGAEAADYQLFILTSLPSSLDYDGAGFSTSSGVLIDAQKLLSSDFMREITYNYGRRMDVLGAGLWSSIKKGAVNLAKNAWANRQQIAQVAGDVLGVARTLRGGERHYSNVTGAGNTQFLGGGSTQTTEFFPKVSGAGRSADVFKRK